MIRKTTYSSLKGICAGFVCFVLFLFFPVTANSSTASFEKARACQTALLKSSKAMKYRHQWEKCIGLYQRVAKPKGKSPLKEKALFHIAELYLGLSKFSGKTSDLKKAEEAAKELKQEYPQSHFVSSIESQLVESQAGKSSSKHPAMAELRGIRYWSYPDYTRVVFDLSRSATYAQEKRSDPKQLWINLHRTQLEDQLAQKRVTIQDGILTQVRVVQQTSQMVRAILDLGESSEYRIIPFSNPDRLVVDVFRGREQTPPSAQKQPSVREIKRILIDPGHGGKDPGAIGRNGLTEKEVVLDVGLRLKEFITSNFGWEVLMTRDRDIFIPLEERTQLANGKDADLFISIHANASPNRKVRGIEIYTLGQATDSAALATAARENSIHEESLKDLDGVIRLMLGDLSIMRRLDDSLEFADTTRQAFAKNLGASYDIIDLGVKQAPFYVLMNAGMPSILTEVSFISNPLEEKQLASSRYRERIAKSLFEGIRGYLLKNSQEARLQTINTSNE